MKWAAAISLLAAAVLALLYNPVPAWHIIGRDDMTFPSRCACQDAGAKCEQLPHWRLP